jgi:subtilisin-like proprotein convertase family protein
MSSRTVALPLIMMLLVAVILPVVPALPTATVAAATEASLFRPLLYVDLNMPHGVSNLVSGDLNGDGALDLLAVSYNYPSQVYLNNGRAGFVPTAAPLNTGGNSTRSAALGDLNGDGHLDIVLGNYGLSQVYLNDGQGNFTPTAALLNPHGNATTSVVLGDLNGDGYLDIVMGNEAPVGSEGQPSQVYLNDGQGGFTPTAVLINPNNNQTRSVALGDLNSDGQLDIVLGNWNQPSQIYLNQRVSGARLSNNPPTIAVSRPGRTPDAGFYSTADIFNSPVISIPYTLADFEGDAVRAISVTFSLDGGGNWRTAVPDDSALTRNRATLPERFPNAAVAPIPIPDQGQITSALTVAAPENGVAGKITDVDVELTINHPLVSNLSASLRAPDGTVVPLFANVGGAGANITGLVLDDQAAASIVTATAPLTGTLRPMASLGTLNGKSPLGQWTLTVSDTVSGNTGALVAWALRIKTTGVAHVFPWDTFASRFFGQSDNVVVRVVALSGATGPHAAADPYQRPYASATSFPFRVRGTQVQVVNPQNQPIPDAVVFRLNEQLPQVQQLFAPRTDAPAYTTNNLGFLGGRGALAPSDQLIALAPIPLPEPYGEVYSPTVRLYVTNITPTASGVTGFSVTEPGVQQVTVSPERPLALTEINSIDPLTPTTRLAVPIFYTVDAAGGRLISSLTARAYLFQRSHGEPSSDYTQVVALGRANNDQILACGARVGDRLCLFEPIAARFGCETIQAGREHLALHTRPEWQPDIQITPVTSTTLEVAVTGVPAGTAPLSAALYPLNDDPLPAPITLSNDGSGVYRGRFTLAYALFGAYIHMKANDRTANGEPRWEAVTSYALDGNAGTNNRVGYGGTNNRVGYGGTNNRVGYGGTFTRTGGAPVSSSEGDVLLVGDELSFAEGQFLLLQTTSSLPPLPPWATLIGQGYRFTTSPNAPELRGTALSFGYLDSEVPAGEENGIRVYYRSPSEQAWRPLPTKLDTYFNLASVPTQGPGLYVLMSSVRVPLPFAGWNNFAYPVPVTRDVALALGSISGQYQIVYSYLPTATSDPWQVYAPAPAPAWASDLKELVFGRGYWIYATQATALLLRGSGAELASGPDTPPALIYGVLADRSAGFAAGQAVEAWVGKTVCGRGVTRLVEGEIVFALKVAASGPTTPECGGVGRMVRITVAGNEVGQASWDNTRAVNLFARFEHQIYLPLVRR